MEEAHSSQPNYYQTTALNYKTDFRKESFDRFDLSRRTNSQQKQESSFTTVSIREPIPSGLFHEVTPATKVNLSSSVRVVSLISNEGFITNQGYPYAYEDAAYCQWSVRLANGTRIKITFEDLDVEFDKDFLEISFGQGNEYYFRRFTGTKVPPASVFNTDKIKIVFKTDRNGHGRGFYIYFKETNEAPSFPLSANPSCSDLSVSREGHLVTPGYPQTHYSNNEFCSWVIAGASNSVIKLEIEDFHTEIYDQLAIGVGLDPHGNASSALIRLFGKVDTPQETIIPANALWFQFRSDESVTETGFDIRYQIIERHICKCGGDVSSRHGVLQSENYPQEYPINSECRWTISGDKGSHIILHFLHFHLQDEHDFLLVGQGPDVFVGNFTQFTGRIEHTKIMRMKMNSVWLHFTSDHVKGDTFYNGFKLAYNIVTAETNSPADIQSHVSNSLIHKHLSDDLEVTSDTITNDGAWNTSKNTNFVVYLQGYSKREVEKKRELLLNHLVKAFVRFCQKKRQENCLIRNGDIRLRHVVTTENKVKIYFNINFQLEKMTTSKREEFQQFLDATHIQLQPAQLNKKTLTSSENFVEEATLPSWLVAVIATVIFLAVAFFAMLLYSLLRSKKTSRSSKGSCQVSSSGQSTAAELEESNAETKIASFIEPQDKVHKSASLSGDQKEHKLNNQYEVSLYSSGETGNPVLSIQPSPIDLANQEEVSVSSRLDHKITLETLQTSASENEDGQKHLVSARKQSDPLPMENVGLRLEEVSTDL